jgi:CSLREA domain-containing protein
VITVTTVADDLIPNDGTVSLREAITAINAGNNLGDPDIIAQNPGTFGVNDTINFNISGSGPRQINVGSGSGIPLPTIVKPLTINGYSQPGASVNTLTNGDNAIILIELSGASAGVNAIGLTLGTGSGGSTIEGLVINQFSSQGMLIQSGGNVVAGNFIGVNPAGTAAQANQGNGIQVLSASSNVIGGTTPAARNVVSGNLLDGILLTGAIAAPATGNLVEGNFVGVNAAGTGPVGVRPSGTSAGTPEGNALFGIEVSGGNANTIGGATAADRNVVGFNEIGIEIDNGGQNNVVQGNFTGVGADGVTSAGNLFQGIALRSSDGLSPPLGPGQANEPAVSGNIIGLNPTTFAGLGNLIEFNGMSGVAVFGNPPQNNATQAQNSGNSILGNSIFENSRTSPTLLPGIDLTNQFVFPKQDGVTPNDSGKNLNGQPAPHGDPSNPNNFQNFPILTSVIRVASGFEIIGTLTQSVSPNTMFRIEFFVSNSDPLSGIPEGQTFLGATNVLTNASGQASFSTVFSVPLITGQIITADATNLTADPSSPAGSVNLFNTSEFSPGMTLAGPANPTRFPISFGAGTNGVQTIVNLNANGQLVANVIPIPGWTGEVRRATGDINDDGVPDTVWAAGSGGGPRVRILSGATGAVLADFFAYAPSFPGGVFVAVGDVNGDGVPDVIVGAGAGGGPEVKVIDGTKLTLTQSDGEISPSALLADFFAYVPTFLGGVTLAAGDVNGDGHDEVITGAGSGGGPQVNVIDGTKLTQVQANGQIASSALLASFFAYDPAFGGGVFVAAGDFNGDSKADVYVGPGPGQLGPVVRVLDGTKLNQNQANGEISTSASFADFFAYATGFAGGVRVDAVDVTGDGLADVVTGAGPGGGPHVRVFQAENLMPLAGFFATNISFTGGVFV